MKLLFIGGVNLGNLPKGGEEYKNQLLISKIRVNFSENVIIDTHGWQKKPRNLLRLIIELFFKEHDVVLISASSVSTYRLLRLIHLLRHSIIYKTTYLVIGGYFPRGIMENRFKWRIYKDLKNIIVQGNSLKRTLRTYSELNNISVVPNFKDFPLIKPEGKDSIQTFKFIYVGRISSSKGINEILQAMIVVAKTQENFQIDFYGPLEEHFDLNTERSKYCGYLDFLNNPEKEYIKLSEYHCMLFPTYWLGEGFPGVLIDAFVAGLPVIATNWNLNTDIIKDGINGYIIDSKNHHSLAEKMLFVIENEDRLSEISKNNRLRAEEFHIDHIWPRLESYLIN